MPSVKHCSKCNASFGCKNDAGGCWCENYTISVPVLKELKDNFDNCLCPACLSAYADKVDASPVYPLIP